MVARRVSASEAFSGFGGGQDQRLAERAGMDGGARVAVVEFVPGDRQAVAERGLDQRDARRPLAEQGGLLCAAPGDQVLVIRADFRLFAGRQGGGDVVAEDEHGLRHDVRGNRLVAHSRGPFA